MLRMEEANGQISRSRSWTRWPYRGAIANRKIGLEHWSAVTRRNKILTATLRHSFETHDRLRIVGVLHSPVREGSHLEDVRFVVAALVIGVVFVGIVVDRLSRFARPLFQEGEHAMKPTVLQATELGNARFDLGR